MKKVFVASENRVKVKAAELGFGRVMGEVEVKGVAGIGSGVGDQPMGDEETLLGAMNRAAGARAKEPGGDYWVGMEGGVGERDGVMEAFAWIVILGRDGKVGRSRTGTIELPVEVAGVVNGGVELGVAMDRVYGEVNSKQKGGAVGILTRGVIDRAEYYAHAVVLGLARWA